MQRWVGRILFIGLLVPLLCVPGHAYNVAVGEYTVGASPADDRDITVSPSFPIQVLWIKCAAAVPGVLRIEGMTADRAKEWATTTNGFANAIQSLSTGTFQVGLHTSVQTPSTTCWYAAFGDDGRGDFAYGVRAGNATNDFDFTTPGFLPGVFLTVCVTGCAASGEGVFRTESHSGDTSSILAGVANAANHIQAFISTGVTLGDSVRVNASGTDYAWMAIKAVSGANLSGSYVGDTTDNTTITAIADPTVILAKASSSSASACGRWGSTGDVSWRFGAVVSGSDRIQAFTSTGFERGLSNCANEDTNTTFWWVTKAPVYATTRKVRTVTIAGGGF